VGSHGPTGIGLSLRETSGPLECGPGVAGGVEIMRVDCRLVGFRGMVPARLCRPEGCGLVVIVNACGPPDWQALGALSGGDCAGLRGGSLGKSGPGRAEEQDQGSQISWPAEPRLSGPMRQGLAIVLLFCGLGKPSISLGFRMLMFQLSLMLYLRQVCLQPLSKVPGAWSSGGM
jgi:hypothetical protein